MIKQNEAQPPAGPAASTEESFAPPPDDEKSLKQSFVEEIGEYLTLLERNCLRLEQNPDDLQTINGLFNPFHSIKSVSAMLGYDDMHRLCHAVENLLDALRRQTLTVDQQAMDVIMDGVYMLGQMHGRAVKALTQEKPYKPLGFALLRARIERLLKKDQPARPRLGEVLIHHGLVSPNKVAMALVEQKTQKPDQPLGHIMVDMGFLNQQQLQQGLTLQKRSPTPATIKQIKVESEKVNNLLSALDELLAWQKNMEDTPIGSINMALNKQHYLTQSAWEAALAMGQTALTPVFEKMRAVAQYVSRAVGKEVELTLEGGELQIDRHIAERIFEPLLHMVRNSIDHGIETPEERLLANKPKQGRLRIRAYKQGADTCIEVSDDGQGLDRQKIMTKLAEKGLYRPGADLSDEQILGQIFEPGFSTATQVNEISGRGVGLDVVYKNISNLGGSVSVRSTPGQGTTFIATFSGMELNKPAT